MATRSLIARKLKGGKYRTIYCHWDGYPSYMVPRLLGYNTPGLVTKLFNLGDLSKLGYTVGEKHPFDKAFGVDSPYKDFCTAYGRDRGEQHVESHLRDSFRDVVMEARNCSAEYIYICDNGEWKYMETGAPLLGSIRPCANYKPEV